MDNRTPFFVVVRVLGFRLNYSEARYYGWKHSVQLGWWLVFFWPIKINPKGGDWNGDF